MSTETLITLIVALVSGAIGVPVLDFIKKALGWDGQKALLLVYALAAVIAVGALAATGSFNPFDSARLLEYFGLIVTTATFVYKLFNKVPQS
jgi:uncharacterized membrane protein YuzA (DUF378 family)